MSMDALGTLETLSWNTQQHGLNRRKADYVLSMQQTLPVDGLGRPLALANPLYIGELIENVANKEP